MSAATTGGVCAACARRTWLLGRLAGHLEPVRARIGELLELDDGSLIEAVAGEERAVIAGELSRFDGTELARARAAAGLVAVCRCDPAYPLSLRDLAAPPAVLHLAGGGPERLAGLLAESPVAIVGARRPTATGREHARGLAAELGRAGLCVVSGLALGVDGAAHAGALSVGGDTLAVLPSGAAHVYPAGHRRLYGRIIERGLAVSELSGAAAPFGWMFLARNRIIAALSRMTVVGQARERSGSLVTARWARRLGRRLGAVPGAPGAPLSAGAHGLLRDGATLVEDVQDVLDALYGAGVVSAAGHRRAALPAAEQALLDALADGEFGDAAFARAGLDADAGLAVLAALELAGAVRRGPGGRFTVCR